MKEIIVTESLKERFWQKVDKGEPDECWEWTGAKSSGYGVIKQNDSILYSHRVSWTLHNGPIPRGLWTLHHCDNPSCVNPAHLFLGTQSDNMQDMYEKGRGEPPEPFGKVLTWPQVRRIRKMYATGEYTQKEIARHLPIDANSVSHIIRNSSWYDPTYTPPLPYAKACGENCAASKLTREDVLDIRDRYENTQITQKSLAIEYGVSRTQIGRIVNRESWKCIKASQ